MSAHKILPKRMDLGVDDVEIENKLAAAREVAVMTNTPTVSFPNDKALNHADAAPQSVKVTPLPAQEREKKRGPRPSAVRRYSVDLPVYLIDEIHKRSFHTSRTKKLVILEALNAGGLKVKDVDLEHEDNNDD
ncbi:hypothetical protein [Hyphomicrobium sp. LHD-15]|uniref:hypothetical protein n=1 Tax=Hyphomicrobium sp. LHD-15 TaxID=3072142 RepID=UPI00280DBEDB|nr:hypothetical protein [Hyphomicrobium sp. LHD-15]MDQ8699254.1 hypothetical protein [Hyphomicrobium sp. LHD-15]